MFPPDGRAAKPLALGLGTWEDGLGRDLLFAHWRVPIDDMRRVVPASLPLDTFDGSAWIGVVPFRMSDVRPRLLPAVPWLSAFPELNVRTYVTLEGKPGVYLFSLDATNPVAVRIARASFGLPYFDAQMACEPDGDGVRYANWRTQRGAHPAEFRARYRPMGDAFAVERNSLEYFLTARYVFTPQRRMADRRAARFTMPRGLCRPQRQRSS